MKNHFPLLHYWFGCYLNQDYDLEFGTPDAALIAFKSKEIAEDLRQLKHELAELIELNLDEPELRDLMFSQLDCGYFYPSEWPTAKDWLKHIYTLLE